MSDPGFDAYLDLLARFLRLGPRQRAEIRRELRAHIEEALDAELERGLSRAEALRDILRDFGDAAELAARFRSAQQRRRWIMHTTLTAACVGFLTLVGSFLVHSAPPLGQAAAATSDDARATAQQSVVSEPARMADSRDDAIKAALNSPIEADFEQIPARDAFDYMQKSMDVNMHVMWSDLGNLGIDAPVTLKLKNLPAGRVLRLLLDTLSPEIPLDFAVEEGVLLIGPKERLANRQSIVIYDIRNLSIYQGNTDPDEGAAAEVAQLVQETVDPESWAENGGKGHIKAFRANLVIVQSGPVHARVEAFLNQLRSALHTNPAK